MSSIVTINQVLDGFVSNDIFHAGVADLLANRTDLLSQPYAPITLAGTAIDFYGDSITAGFGVSAKERWPALLCAALGKTENNFGADLNQWPDNKCYNQSTHTNPSFHAFGINDHRFQAPNVFDQLQRCALNDVLFTTLPASCIKNVQSSSVVKTGTWEPTLAYASSFGMRSPATGSTLSTTVSGRYVCIGMTAHADTASSVYRISVDGVLVNTGNIRLGIAVTTNGAGYTREVWVYDTRSVESASHTIVYTYYSGGVSVFVDWIGAFNANQAGCNPSFLLDVYSLNSTINPSPSAIGNKYVFKMMYKELARLMRNVWGLPVYFIEDSGSYPVFGNLVNYSLAAVSNPLSSVSINPRNSGHSYVFDRIQAFLKSGEFVLGKFT